MKERKSAIKSQVEQQGIKDTIIYGARKQDINRKHLVEILTIYGEVAGVSGFVERNGPMLLAGDMLRMLREDSVGMDLRYGSILSGHTKLMSKYENDLEGRRVVKFYLNPNLGPNSKEAKKGEELAADFRIKVNEYLIANNIARKIR